MTVKALPPAPIPLPCVWCGFYVGLNAGGSWDRNAADFTFFGATPPVFASASPQQSGFIGAGQAGYNWQWGSFVLGIEGDIAWRDRPPLLTFLPSYRVIRATRSTPRTSRAGSERCVPGLALLGATCCSTPRPVGHLVRSTTAIRKFVCRPASSGSCPTPLPGAAGLPVRVLTGRSCRIGRSASNIFTSTLARQLSREALQFQAASPPALANPV